MVNLHTKPYCLGPEEIAWVENTIAGPGPRRSMPLSLSWMSA